MTHIRKESITPPALTFDDVQIREELMSPPPLFFDDPEVPIHQESIPPHSSEMATVPSKRRREDDEAESEGRRVSP
jgi:hypothetical protein